MTPLFDQLAQLSGLARPLILGGFLVLLRIGAAVAVLPVFGETSLPQRLRLAVALAFTAVVAPAVLPPGGTDDLPLLAFVAEPAVGLILGLSLRLLVLALEMAAAMIAQSTSLAQLFGGAGGEPQPAMGHLLTLAALALAAAGGLHLRLAELFILSYRLFPAGGLPAAGDAAQWGLEQTAQATALALSLAAPFVAAAFVYNLALGFINKALPQLAVSFIGAPALTLGSLALFAVAAPVLLSVWLEAFQQVLAHPPGAAP